MYVYVNGAIVKEEEATISIFEHGFMYGLGAFETLRIYNGHPFLFSEHMERLKVSLNELGITMFNNWEKTLLESVRSLLKANALDDAYVRINVSAGVGSLGLQVEPYEQPTIIIYSKPLPQENGLRREKNLQLLKTKRNTPEGLYRIKSHHFLNNVIGKREVGNSPDMEGLFLTEEGYVAEGVVSNIFWVKDGVLFTPALNTGILGGITRKFILCLAKKRNLHVKVGKFHLSHLMACDEAFLTNSIQEIVAVKTIQKRELSDERELTTFFSNEYEKYRMKLWTLDDLQ
jgi:4-amino-4-deoxychorismate lyase